MFEVIVSVLSDHIASLSNIELHSSPSGEGVVIVVQVETWYSLC